MLIIWKPLRNIRYCKIFMLIKILCLFKYFFPRFGLDVCFRFSNHWTRKKRKRKKMSCEMYPDGNKSGYVE